MSADYSLDHERQMHYILDEGISELRKSTSNNNSLKSNNTSDKSFTLRNHH